MSDFAAENINKNGSYKITAWILRDYQHPNKPWWYCSDCNLASHACTIEERDRQFGAHLSSDRCVRNRKKLNKKE